jgi:hypothetical protein
MLERRYVKQQNRRARAYRRPKKSRAGSGEMCDWLAVDLPTSRQAAKVEGNAVTTALWYSTAVSLSGFLPLA